MTNSFYSQKELEKLGFKKIGENVLISKKTSIYGAENMSLGNNIRIDDFCILSGNIVLENYIHIAAYTALFAGYTGIIMKSFTGLSSRCAIYAESDDYSGDYLTNPTVDRKYTNRVRGKVILNKHVLIGAGTTILPNVEIGEGSAVGSMSLVNKSLDEWGIFAGIPCRKMKERSKKLLNIEEEFLDEV